MSSPETRTKLGYWSAGTWASSRSPIRASSSALLGWINIVLAMLVVVFNLFGLPYKGLYDNFLIVVSFVLNVLTVWYGQD